MQNWKANNLPFLFHVKHYGKDYFILLGNINISKYFTSLKKKESSDLNEKGDVKHESIYTAS